MMFAAASSAISTSSMAVSIYNIGFSHTKMMINILRITFSIISNLYVLRCIIPVNQNIMKLKEHHMDILSMCISKELNTYHHPCRCHSHTEKREKIHHQHLAALTFLSNTSQPCHHHHPTGVQVHLLPIMP